MTWYHELWWKITLLEEYLISESRSIWNVVIASIVCLFYIAYIIYLWRLPHQDNEE